MREALTESKAEATYEAAFRCLELVEEHFRFCAGLQTKYPIGRGVERIDLSAEDHRVITDAVRGLQVIAKDAQRLVADLDREIPALHEEPIRSGHVVASSWAEATVMVASAYAKLLHEWESFEEKDPQDRQRVFSLCFAMMPNMPEYRAGLKVEAARLLHRARVQSPESRYAYEFLHLKPQSRRLFKLLTERQGRRVEYQTIAQIVCGDPKASNARIQKAMWRLKDELKDFGSSEVADAIKGEEGAYCMLQA